MQTTNFGPDIVLQNQNYCQGMNNILPINNNIANVSGEQEAHFMPTPSQTAPWKPNDMIWAVASKDYLDNEGYGVMHFDAQTACSTNIHHKRKSDSQLLHLPPKQFISEEKITAHFNGLHISSDYIQCGNSDLDADITGLSAGSGKNFTNLTFKDYQLTARELAEKLKNATSIVLNEEVRKLAFAPRDLSSLPESLYKRAENPCTALIPYVSPLTTLSMRRQAESADEAANNEKNYISYDNANTITNTTIDFNNQNDDKMDLDT